jgi:hypothetical protein
MVCNFCSTFLFSLSPTQHRTMESLFRPQAPIHQISHNISGFNTFATDRTRAIPVHNYSSTLPAPPKSEQGKVTQCAIYDSGDRDAKLIGIEYIIDEATFLTLDDDEKRYWHSRALRPLFHA